VDSIEENPNFVWTQLKNKKFLEILSKPLPFEENSSETAEISLTKHSIKQILAQNSISPLISHEELKKFIEILIKSLQPSRKSPISNEKVRKSIISNEKAFEKPMKTNEKSHFFLKKTEETHYFIENPLNFKLHNHFQGDFHLGNKKALFHNLRILYDCMNESLFTNIPVTFHIRKGLEDPEYRIFLAYFNEMKEKTNKKKLFIIKPGESSNRGNGIVITDEISQINEIISSKEVHKNGKIKTFIIQSYIENPLLYHKRKFDIRCYILLTNFNRNLKGFWYKDGYIRTSSKDFSLKNMNNRLIHLTNDAVQKKSDDYGKFEASNKVF